MFEMVVLTVPAIKRTSYELYVSKVCAASCAGTAFQFTISDFSLFCQQSFVNLRLTRLNQYGGLSRQGVLVGKPIFLS